MKGPAYLPLAIFAAMLGAALPSARSQDRGDPPSPLAVTADFNQDGIPDIAEVTAADSQQPLLTVQLGQPGGTFRTLPSHTSIGGDPSALIVGDFNGDGKSDVIAGDADGSVVEFLGDGKGHLTSAGPIAQLGSVVSLAVGHFTHSGRLDLAVSDARSNSAVIFVSAGDGSFQRAWSFSLPRIGDEFHLATADFNADGISDLVITREDDDNYEVMLGNGNGTFTYAPELSHLKDPNSYCPS